MMGIISYLFGNKGGVTKADIEKEIERDKFSKFLPWVAYDPETSVYLNIDNTLSFLWECSPLCFAGGKTEKTLEGLFRILLPNESIVQFILYADDYITPYVEGYGSLKDKENKVIRNSVGTFSEFLMHGTKGLENIGGTPLRNFRLFVAVKMPSDDKSLRGITPANVKIQVEEILKGANLYPIRVTPEMLLAWMRRLFNPEVSEGVNYFNELINEAYDDNVPIRKQILSARYSVRKAFSNIQVGEYRIADNSNGEETFVPLRHFKCITPQAFPRFVNLFQTNELFGGVWGVSSDPDQIKTPFLYSLNIVFQNLKAHIHTKCNLVLQQQGIGSFAPSLMRKKDEYMWAADELEKGTRFLRVIPTLWVWGKTDKEASESVAKTKRIWESHGYVMQEDMGVLSHLFISSLPFGLYNVGKNVDNLDRDFIVPSTTVPAIVPCQADFAGAGKPELLFLGRKGQVCSLDIFDKTANNHNVFVAASSGSGKSFFVNYLTANYYASGVKVRLIDIGGSYKKATYLFNARYLDFSPSSNICINPIADMGLGENEEDFSGNISAVTNLIYQMCYSTTDKSPVDTAETEVSLIKMAILWATEEMKRTGNLNGIDLVSEYLSEFPRYSDEFYGKEDQPFIATLMGLAKGLAFNLKDFISTGAHGRWFNGPSTFNITNDDFVVLELEHLKPVKELFKVVTLLVIDAVTRDLYLGERHPTLIVFDEAWQFLKERAILKDMIEEGYRRARKYSGSFIVIVQSILDRKAFGSIGDVINTNSAFKFYLEAPDFDTAKAEKLIDYDEFTMAMLKSVKSSKPMYSEIFMDTPFGVGVVRLVVDDYSYYVYTSSSNEINEIDGYYSQYKMQGLADDEAYDFAIKDMLRKYRPNSLSYSTASNREAGTHEA